MKISTHIVPTCISALLLLGWACSQEKNNDCSVYPIESEIRSEGETLDVALTSNQAWVLQGSYDWCIPDVTSGTGNGTIKFTIQKNTTYEDRVADFRVVLTNGSESHIVIKQLQNDALSITTKDYVVTPKAQDITISVSSNVDFHFNLNGNEWVTVGETKALNNYSPTLHIAENTGNSNRTASILLSDSSGNITQTITIIQACSAAVLYYSTTDNQSIKINQAANKVLKSIYENGKGVLIFDSPISSIPASTFKDCNTLSSVIIPDRISSIDEFAFARCTSLNNLNIPETVNSIGKSAFEGCSSLSDINIPSGITTLSDRVFMGTAFQEFTISSNIKTIGDYAFASTRLVRIEVPNTVTSLGNGVFSGCSLLTDVVLPSNMTAITPSLFSGCSSLSTINLPESLLSIGESAFYYCTSLRSIVLPNKVESIGAKSFSYCSSMEELTVPYSVNSIDKTAFNKCVGTLYLNAIINTACLYGNNGAQFNRIIFGEKVSEIPANICNGNTFIEYVYLPKSIKTINAGAFTDCSNLTTVESVASTTTIGNGAFKNCTSLKTISLNSGITTIGKNAFYNCSSLQQLKMPNTVTTIGEYCFYSCSGLKSITLSSKLTALPEYCFALCSGLTSFDVPASVQSLSQYSLGGCTSINTIYFRAKNAPIAWDNCFGNNANSGPGMSIGKYASGNKIMYIPKDSTGYTRETNWSRYWYYISMYCGFEISATL